MIPLSSSNCSTTVVVVVGGGTLSSADTEPEPTNENRITEVQAIEMMRRLDISRTVTILCLTLVKSTSHRSVA